MLISRNEALEQLREIRNVNHKDPATAHALAVSVLLDIVDDEHIRFAFKLALGFPEPLDHLTKLAAGDDVQSTSPFTVHERRHVMNAAELRISDTEHPS